MQLFDEEVAVVLGLQGDDAARTLLGHGLQDRQVDLQELEHPAETGILQTDGHTRVASVSLDSPSLAAAAALWGSVGLTWLKLERGQLAGSAETV